jgi:AcrR family transcriptional regulator
MINLLKRLKIEVNDKIYLKNPDSSELGRKILSESIILINEIGYETFNFKKLGAKIGSTETSVYRYFESKQKLLLYLTSWYWGWLEYKIVFSTTNIENAEERLMRSVAILTEGSDEEIKHPYLDLKLLHKIIMTHSSKTYLKHNVDIENEIGVYEGYKQIVRRVSDIILEINSNYPYPQMLVSTIIEGSHHQHFFAEHLPSLTNMDEQGTNMVKFYQELVKNAILDCK